MINFAEFYCFAAFDGIAVFILDLFAVFIYQITILINPLTILIKTIAILVNQVSLFIYNCFSGCILIKLACRRKINRLGSSVVVEGQALPAHALCKGLLFIKFKSFTLQCLSAKSNPGFFIFLCIIQCCFKAEVFQSSAANQLHSIAFCLVTLL